MILFLITLFVALNADESREIVEKLHNNMRGKNVYMQMSMSITSLGHTRTMKMKSWSEGEEKSFVKTIYPPKSKGITFLSLGQQMWQYVPKIERVIKIPPSMMLQSWMGSDITNDDLVKQSSLLDDYTSRLLDKNGSIATIELIPKEDSAVVWGKIISKVDTKTYTGMKDVFYDEDGEVVRIFYYENVKKFGKYYMPTYWKIEPVNKTGNFTEIHIEEVEFDTEISQQYFKKSALKRFSR